MAGIIDVEDQTIEHQVPIKKASAKRRKRVLKDQGLYVPHANAYLVPLGGTPTQAQVLIPVVKKAKKLKPKRKGAFGLPEKPSDTTNPSATLNKDNPNRRDQT